MICIHCGEEDQPAFGTCAICGATLLAGTAPVSVARGLQQEVNDSPSKKLVVAYVTAGELRAQIVKGMLEGAGIPAILKYESAGVVYGLTVDGLGEVKILVPESWHEKAAELLDGLDI